MLFTPHQNVWDWGSRHWDWARSYWLPIFCVDYGRPRILWGTFVGQTAFVAVLAAVLVNLRKRRKNRGRD